ncbi:hypothetical protein EMCRGX_G026242 [Ephydatia muelleri]
MKLMKQRPMQANACFGDIGVKVVRGQQYLGGFIGDPEGTKHYVEAKRIVMDVEKNSASNMLFIVKKVALSPSAIMKCEML